MTARVLEGAGYTVHVATDGNEARQKIDELGSQLALLVSDVVMPGCSGYDVAEHAGRVAPGAAVILTSGFIDDAARRSERPGVPIMWKPVAPHDLVRAVAEALEARASSPTPAVEESVAIVLVVEDDEAMRKIMVRVLTGAGYVAQTAATIAEARLALEAEPSPHIVLCDLSLPDGSGAELLDWIEATRPALCRRVFVLTGGATDAAGKRVTKSGIFRVLSKPIRPATLLEILAVAGTTLPS